MTAWHLPLSDRLERGSIPEPNTGCFLWLGACCSKGYGSIRIKGKTIGAHRVAFEVARGPIPSGLLVLHQCDVPCCVNPDHLFVGTNADNVADREAKGRRASCVGVKNPSAKLTEDQVRRIRVALGSHREIGRRFGVKAGTVGDIKRGSKWSHLR